MTHSARRRRRDTVSEAGARHRCRDRGLFEASVVALDVRENGIVGVEKAASAAGGELRVFSGTPVDQIIAAGEDRDVVALVLGARGARGGPEPAGHTALEVITRVPKPVIVVPPHAQPRGQLARILVPLDGSPRELARARGDDRTRPPTAGGDPRASHPLTGDRTGVRRSRAPRHLGLGPGVPHAPHRDPARAREAAPAAWASPPMTSPTSPASRPPTSSSLPGARSSSKGAPRSCPRRLPGRASRRFFSPSSRAIEAPSGRARLRRSPQKGSVLDPDAVRHP